MAMSRAITTNVYGRRRANRTIHIAKVEGDPRENSRTLAVYTEAAAVDRTNIGSDFAVTNVI
jgi:hypothetical protein